MKLKEQMALEYSLRVMGLKRDIPDVTRGEKSAYLAGFEAASGQVLKYLLEYREAYAEDLIRPIEKGEPDPISRDRVMGQTARFILDNSITHVGHLGEEEVVF